MNPYISIYKNNPTAGGTDGTAVSQDGSMVAPVTVTLDASQSESQVVKLAVRTETGYETDGNTTLSIDYDSEGHWKLDTSASGSFSSTSITLSSTIDDTNTIFYAKASSSSSEGPGRYDTPQIVVQAKIVLTE